MEIDELANSEEDEESDVLPLVMSDLDPPYGKAAAPSPPRKKSPAQPTQCTHPPSLSIRENSTLRKTNGTSKASSATSGPRPVVTIPISSSTPTAHRPPSATPRQAEPMTVSVTLPALYTQKKHEKTGSSDSVQPISTTESLSKPTTAKSSVVAVGRRSKPVPDVRIKGGRPKGWKPGMSYREVALRNAGIDPNDPSLPPEILLPPRVRKPGRPPGRPRLPGRPKVNPSQPLGYKRPGRPPIQSIDTVQRSIFLAGQACFAPFVCEWAGCRAELQNMTTLHRHVVVVHGQPSSTAKTCQWRRCAHRVPAVQYKDDADTDADGRTFLEHMEYQHLTPLAWYRGDGFANTGHIGPPQPPPAAALLARSRTREETKPTTDEEKSRALNSATPMVIKAVVNTAPEMPLDGISSEDLPRYLLDDKGRQVTPLLRDTVLESSPVFWSEEERGRRLKDLYRQQQQNLNKRPDRSLGRMM
ncbi:hypothetical protein SBRCBS47491_000377 [Sporothrix bragantina]|uniref:C2H2-type domain-containing protein n=1 Tax=Sporothrix bragantina TaxID=671064 RepID=A0ABP0APV8_9PEZI